VGSVHASMGNIFFKKFKYSQAIEHFKKALDHSTQYGGKQSQQSADYWFALASVYDKQGEVKTALDHYKNCRDIQVKLGGDTGKVDQVIDELEDYMVNANLQSRSS
jgi:tetratricopeptide (TPR) repeat protein